MILLLGIFAWTILLMVVCYISWRKVAGHVKVYLLIVYNAVFLTGVFGLFLLFMG